MFARILFTIILLGPATAFSDEEPITNLISLLRIDNEFSEHIERWTREYDAKAQHDFPSKDPREIHDVFYQEITKAGFEIRSVAHKILAKAYTSDELVQLIDFYRTEAGQKTLTPWIQLDSPAGFIEEDAVVSAFRATSLGQKDARITQCLKNKLWATAIGALTTAHIHTESLIKNDAGTGDLRVNVGVNFKTENPCP